MSVTLTRRAAALAAAAGVVVPTAVSVAWLWGFTVDDAWIAPRVAAHLARGAGYRFNESGEPVDAVTPLGFAHLLMPFAKYGADEALRAARAAGAVIWILSVAALGMRAHRAGARPLRFAPLAIVPWLLPTSAWASAGLETGIVLGLATLALRSGRLGNLGAGLAAAWRPELVPWALVLCLARDFRWRAPRAGAAPSPDLGSIAEPLLVAVGPSIVVSVIRAAVFGRAAPLAVFAKPSDVTHGVYYVLAALIWCGVPALVFAPRLWPRLPHNEKAILAAAATHCVALVAAGGDWMPYFRLFAPVIPGLLLVAVAIAERARPLPTALRTAVGLGFAVTLFVSESPVARRIETQRALLVAGLREVLPQDGGVATVDVGWVGAAHRGTVVDLAGVTDEEVAVLPGGHTSKRLPSDFLRRRAVDALVLLLAPEAQPERQWQASRFARAVEQHVARLAEGHFKVVATLPLVGTRQAYLVAIAHPSPAEPAFGP